MLDVQTISVLTLPSVPFAERVGLPRCPAIYFVLNGEGTVLYVGGSVNLAERWGAHHRVAKLTDEGATRIAWLVIDDVGLLTGVEAACIAYFEPVCNASAGGYPRDPHAMGEPLMSLTGRFPVSVVARIDAHAEAMRGAMPGVSIGRTDVLRSLVVQALDALYAPTAHAVTDTVTDTTGLDERQVRRMLRQEFEALMGRHMALLKSIDQAQPVTDTVTDTPVTDTVTDTDARQTTVRRRTRQAAPAH